MSLGSGAYTQRAYTIVVTEQWALHYCRSQGTHTYVFKVGGIVRTESTEFMGAVYPQTPPIPVYHPSVRPCFAPLTFILFLSWDSFAYWRESSSIHIKYWNPILCKLMK